MWPVYLLQTCSGRIGNCSNCESTLLTGALYFTTSVVGVGAVALVMWAIRPASFAAPVFLYLTAVVIVQAASAAVSGWPSVHFALATVVNVQVLPSFDTCHDLAKSGANCRFVRSYWMSDG